MSSAQVEKEWNMRGKTILFTGASRGMGHIAAMELARLGAKILVVGHNDVRGTAAVNSILDSGNSAEFLHADMGDARQVCSLAETVLARKGRIDVLIHNAGGFPPHDARTREGVDLGFAQNFLGAFLLTRLLEERLLASAPARVIAVTSNVHRGVKELNELDSFVHPGPALPKTSGMKKGSYQMHSYRVAKFAVTAWIYSLARRWAGSGVTANILDPRLVKSKIGEAFEGPALMRVMMSRIIPFFVAAGTKRGSEQYLRLAADPILVNVSGMYFVSGKEKEEASSPLTRDPDAQESIDKVAEEWAAPFLRGQIVGR